MKLTVEALCFVLLLGLCISFIQGEFSCFRKFRKKRQNCGGVVKKKIIANAEECCSRRGQGFNTQELNLVGPNKYSCTSCQEWERQKNEPGSITTDETPSIQPEFVCFRKFRKKRSQCGGPKTKPNTNTPETCCQTNKYGGFSKSGLDLKGKNRYTCTSCKDWQTQVVTTTTTPVGVPEWGTWSECQATCGQGTKVRYSKCATCGSGFEPKMEHKPCIINYYCTVNGNWGEWESWKPCSVSCNGGVRRRERKCDYPAPKHGGQDCTGSREDMETCNEHQCDVNGSWGPWTRFGHCSQTCGRGILTRTRACNRPTPSGGGKPCRGPASNTRRCEHRKCPVHGGWSPWDEWTKCTVTCGTGTMTRSRVCNRPTPLFGGRSCEGSGTETTECSSGPPCPIHGGWSDWTSYGRCRARQDCSHGHRLRSRVCNKPRPQHRGRLCRGDRVERERCFDQESCPVDGGWCEYKDWSTCSATCRGFSSTQTRFRACQCPTPSNGGKHCSGDYLETRTCEGTSTCSGISVNINGRSLKNN